MTNVFYNGYPVHKTNAWLGGIFFHEGIAAFTDIEEGIRFASMFYLKYEVLEAEKKSKKKVGKVDGE